MIAIGYLFGKLVPVPVVAQTNPQVAGRVHPDLVDLVAALATGAVGAFAVIRPDVSDTLPGVAIAISLVPPLCVVGLTLESGADGQAVGALILFLTNVGAILLSGLIVMTLYRVFEVAATDEPAGEPTSRSGHREPVRRHPDRPARALLRPDHERHAQPRARRSGRARSGRTQSGMEDPVGHLVGGRRRRPGFRRLPRAEPAPLQKALDAAGLRKVHVVLELVPSQRIRLPGD